MDPDYLDDRIASSSDPSPPAARTSLSDREVDQSDDNFKLGQSESLFHERSAVSKMAKRKNQMNNLVDKELKTIEKLMTQESRCDNKACIEYKRKTKEALKNINKKLITCQQTFDYTEREYEKFMAFTAIMLESQKQNCPDGYSTENPRENPFFISPGSVANEKVKIKSGKNYHQPYVKTE